MTLQRIFASTPTALDEDEDDPLKAGKGTDVAKYRTVAKRLETQYGTGDSPQLRRKLYQRIQRCTIEHGPDCYDVVRACVAAASCADQPDRYFCRSVTSELKNLGYWEIPVDF